MKRVLPCILAVSLLWGVAVTEAARPILGARYKGTTSQERKIKLRISKERREIESIDARLRTNCPQLGVSSTQGVDVSVRVRRDGRFSSTFVEVALLEGLSDPVVLGGRRRNVFDVTKSQLSGRFVTRRTVRGSWRLRSVVYDRDTYPDSATPVERCDTGSVSFRARRRR